VSVQFANPTALILLALLVPVLLWARRSMAGLGRVRGLVAVGIRTSIVILLTLALAQVQWRFTQDEMTVIYLLDQSLSIPASTQRDALRFVEESQKKRRSDDKVGLVLFGRSAALERRPEAYPLLRSPGETAGDTAAAQRGRDETYTVQSVISPQRTNTAAALRLGLAAFPAGGRKRLVLVSDGNENLGSAAEAAEVARQSGVRVDVLPVHYAYEDEVMIEKVVAPSEVEKGASFEVRVVVNAFRPQRAVLRLFENGTLISSGPVDLKRGRNALVVQRTLPEPGFYSYDATVESPTDTLFANNRASAFAVVRGRGRVLYVEGNLARAGSLRGALAAEGLDVHVVGLEALPLTIGQVIPYDVVMLSDVSAANLGEAGMRALELAVKDWGVGLVMVGGEHSFGPGGYQGSAVERALPVSMDVKERRVMPAGALVVILHTCEIARGNFWAQQIALAALKVLSRSDEFGILYYDWKNGDKWLFPLQRVGNKNRMAGLIRGVAPGDSPSFILSLKMAHKALKKSSASVKHVVIISDGDPEYPADDRVLSMVADKITISTVAINPHSQTDSDRLSHVASIGAGRFYEPLNSNQLPQIFIKEAATVRRSQIFEEPFTPRQALASEILKGIGAREYPSLKGYVVTTPKPLAEVPLVTHHRDPLLAHWQYGLGRAVAFTSDAKARWAGNWVSWPKFEQFWTQLVRWTARNVTAAGVRARTSIANDRVHVLVDALDTAGRFLNNLRFTGTLITPEHREVALRVRQTGPGRYEADFDTDRPGTHYLSLRYTDEKGRAALHTHGIVVPYSAEYRDLKADEERLAAIAKATGGRVLTGEENVFARTFPSSPRLSEAWPLLLLMAILLVPADVFVRRVFVDYRAAWARVWSAALAAAGLARRRGAAEPTHVTALLSRKELTREQLAQRGRKFEAVGDVELIEPTLAPGLHEVRPIVQPEQGPEVTDGRPKVVRADETFTGRLLRARQKQRDETDRSDTETER